MTHESNHNLLSLPLPERAKLELESAFVGPRERWTQIEKAIANAPATIETEDQAENFTTVVAQLQALLKRVDRTHDDVKEPYLAAGRAVDADTARLRELVDTAKRELERKLTAYQVAKQRKIEAERQAQRQTEAADPEPSFVPHAETDRRLSRVRSIEGASAHLTNVTSIEILDVTKIPLRYLNRPKVKAALVSEMLPDARKGDAIEGIKVHTGHQSRVKA